MVEIKFIPSDLTRQKNIQVQEAYIKLFDDYFIYRTRFIADEQDKDDDKMPWKEKLNDFEAVHKKFAVIGLERSYIEDQKAWKLLISISGSSQDIWIYSKRKSECDSIFEQLFKYFFDGN